MLDTVTRPQAELLIEAPSKRDLVERELLTNPERSDREIGRIAGCDHKTVGSARERLGDALARLVSPSISPGALHEVEDGYHFWSVPAQTAIECRAKENGSVELWQGADEADAGVVICVAAGNAVMLARHILYAAGFYGIGIYTHIKSGNVDIADGDLARSFYDE